jgi:hypothetical protein
MTMDTEKTIEQYLSTAELMTTLSRSRSIVRRLKAKGMPNIMVGAVHRFPKDQVLAWLPSDPRRLAPGRRPSRPA